MTLLVIPFTRAISSSLAFTTLTKSCLICSILSKVSRSKTSEAGFMPSICMKGYFIFGIS